MAGETLIAAAAVASAPAVVLVNRVADAVGGVAAPWQIRRVAQAQADAAIIVAEADVQVTELQRRAGQRLLEEETRKQENMEQILAEALPRVDAESSAPEEIDRDWLTNFFEKGRLISSTDVQGLWSRILAGEANKPGTFSRKTINVLEDVGTEDAQKFSSLCRFSWFIHDESNPLIFSKSDRSKGLHFYDREGLNFDGLVQLEDVGLIRYDPVNQFAYTQLPRDVMTAYYGVECHLVLGEGIRDTFGIGDVIFTRAGKELYEVFRADTQPVDGFYDFIRDDWASRSLVPPGEPAPPE
ncbi:MAG: DUF2806 domain-containing protein [Chloroflexi bacterium]|nr:DUF2806 domain-containing protein [Chloroflexota bacterium]